MIKNVLLMSVFGLFMTVAFAGQSVPTVSFVAAAYADNDNESNDNASNRQDDNENESQGVSENAHDSNRNDDESSNDDGNDSASNDDDNDSASNDDGNSAVEFSCPEGVTTCYRADGSEYTDVNNLSPTAAGAATPGSGTATYANPRNIRSF